MGHKLWFLTKQSLKRKTKSKWFVVVNIILLVVIAGLLNIDNIIGVFGGDFNKNKKIYVIDNTHISYNILKENITSTDKVLNQIKKSSYDVKEYNKTFEEAKKLIKKENDSVVIEIKEDLSFRILSESYIDGIDSQVINGSLTNLKTSVELSKLNLTQEQIKKLYEQPKIERVILDKDKKSDDENMEVIMTTVFPFIILPFFILSIFLFQMIGAEVNDEKSTRAMEIIISNVSAKVHFFSKVIAGNIFILMQGAILLLDCGVGLLIRNIVGSKSITESAGFNIADILKSMLSTSLVDKLIYIIPLMLVSMILTFICYSLVAGILASMTTNTEDYQHIQAPVMMISLIGYYLAIMAGVFKGALFIRILSYVPFISAILAPSLLVLGQISIIDVLIGIGILVVTILLLVKYGLKIYKVGILNYSSKDIWKKIIKAAKE